MICLRPERGRSERARDQARLHCCVCDSLCDDGAGAGGLAPYSDVARVAAKSADVGLDPLERGALVEEADIQVAGGVGGDGAAG